MFATSTKESGSFRSSVTIETQDELKQKECYKDAQKNLFTIISPRENKEENEQLHCLYYSRFVESLIADVTYHFKEEFPKLKHGKSLISSEDRLQKIFEVVKKEIGETGLRAIEILLNKCTEEKNLKEGLEKKLFSKADILTTIVHYIEHNIVMLAYHLQCLGNKTRLVHFRFDYVLLSTQVLLLWHTEKAKTSNNYCPLFVRQLPKNPPIVGYNLLEWKRDSLVAPKIPVLANHDTTVHFMMPVCDRTKVPVDIVKYLLGKDSLVTVYLSGAPFNGGAAYDEHCRSQKGRHINQKKHVLQQIQKLAIIAELASSGTTGLVGTADNQALNLTHNKNEKNNKTIQAKTIMSAALKLIEEEGYPLAYTQQVVESAFRGTFRASTGEAILSIMSAGLQLIKEGSSPENVYQLVEFACSGVSGVSAAGMEEKKHISHTSTSPSVNSKPSNAGMFSRAPRQPTSSQSFTDETPAP